MLDVTLSIVAIVESINFLGLPALEEISIYILVDVFKYELFNLNLPGPGSVEVLSPKSMRNSYVEPPKLPSLP